MMQEMDNEQRAARNAQRATLSEVQNIRGLQEGAQTVNSKPAEQVTYLGDQLRQ